MLTYPRPTVVGILNVTPDSFSDGGHFLQLDRALQHAERLIAEGADILDIGGESTRPGAAPVSAEEETAHVVPVIQAIAERFPEIPLSVDTIKSVVARAALRAGASIVNDVSAFRLDPKMATVCADAGCTVILMHSRGTMAELASYHLASYEKSVSDEVYRELLDRVDYVIAAGVKREAIILDPGIGFAKTSEHSINALANLPTLAKLGFPIMAGVSRKRFIGEITGVQLPEERDYGTVGANVAALSLGASWFRVHNVAANRQALDVAHAILTQQNLADHTRLSIPHSGTQS